MGGIHDISIEDVHASHVLRPGSSAAKHQSGRLSNYTSSIEGQPPDAAYGLSRVHRVGPNISLKRVSLSLSGGGEAADVDIVPPHASGSYPPRDLGVRPAYGMFMRRAEGVTLSDVAITSEGSEGRPAFVLSDVERISFGAGVTAERPKPPHKKNAAFDIGLRGECEGVSTAGSGLVTKKLA